jgi:drug/metabolite transporter (DMT)-like permease
MPADYRARLLVLIAAVLFSTGGTAIKATSFNAWQVAGFRSGIAALTIAMMLPAARKSWTPRAALIGVIYMIMTVSFSFANKLTTAANAIFLQDLAPVYIMLLGPLLLKEKVRREDGLFLLLMAAGGALVFSGGQAASATAPDPWRGNLVSLLASVAWASVIMLLRWIERQGVAGEPGMAVVMSGNALAFLVCSAGAFPVEGATLRDWITVAYLGAVQIGVAYVFLTRGMRGVPAVEASLLLLVEPALSPLWAWMVHGEQPPAVALAGGALIIGATAARVLWRARQ